jgi:hypothetical protein
MTVKTINIPRPGTRHLFLLRFQVATHLHKIFQFLHGGADICYDLLLIKSL